VERGIERKGKREREGNGERGEWRERALKNKRGRESEGVKEREGGGERGL